MQFHIVHLDHMCSDVLVPTSPEETPTVIHQVVELDQWPGPLSMPTYKEEGSMEHPINIDLPDPTLESLLLMHSNCIIDPVAEYLLSWTAHQQTVCGCQPPHSIKELTS